MKRPAITFRPWKPAACADCGRPNPSHSRNHMRGPWRCAACDRLAGGLL